MLNHVNYILFFVVSLKEKTWHFEPTLHKCQINTHTCKLLGRIKTHVVLIATKLPVREEEVKQCTCVSANPLSPVVKGSAGETRPGVQDSVP